MKVNFIGTFLSGGGVTQRLWKLIWIPLRKKQEANGSVGFKEDPVWRLSLNKESVFAQEFRYTFWANSAYKFQSFTLIALLSVAARFLMNLLASIPGVNKRQFAHVKHGQELKKVSPCGQELKFVWEGILTQTLVAYNSKQFQLGDLLTRGLLCWIAYKTPPHEAVQCDKTSRKPCSILIFYRIHLVKTHCGQKFHWSGVIFATVAFLRGIVRNVPIEFTT